MNTTETVENERQQLRQRIQAEQSQNNARAEELSQEILAAQAVVSQKERDVEEAQSAADESKRSLVQLFNAQRNLACDAAHLSKALAQTVPEREPAKPPSYSFIGSIRVQN